MVETFFKSIKAELIWRNRWETRRQAEGAVFLESQGSLRQFPLSQFHKLVPEGFSWSSPSQALSWCAIQAVTNRFHISI